VGVEREVYNRTIGKTNQLIKQTSSNKQ